MTIAHGHGKRGVTQQGGHPLQLNPGLNLEGSMRMAQGVRRNILFNPGRFCRALQGGVEGNGGLTEDPAGVQVRRIQDRRNGRRLFIQCLECQGRERENPRLAVLRRVPEVFPGRANEAISDRDRTVFPVNIGPLQTQQFPDPDPGCNAEQERRTPGRTQDRPDPGDLLRGQEHKTGVALRARGRAFNRGRNRPDPGSILDHAVKEGACFRVRQSLIQLENVQNVLGGQGRKRLLPDQGSEGPLEGRFVVGQRGIPFPAGRPPVLHTTLEHGRNRPGPGVFAGLHRAPAPGLRWHPQPDPRKLPLAPLRSRAGRREASLPDPVLHVVDPQGAIHLEGAGPVRIPIRDRLNFFHNERSRKEAERPLPFYRRTRTRASGFYAPANQARIADFKNK